jgi:hypothetical protein
MKKLFVALFVLALCSASAFAQITVGKNPNGKIPTLTEKQFLEITKLNQPIRNPEFERQLQTMKEEEAASPTGLFSEEALALAPTAAPTVTIVNAASQAGCPSSGSPSSRCTNGQFITVYVSHLPTSASNLGSYSTPWPQVLSDGFKLRFDSCGSPPNNARNTALLGMWDLGGYYQINAYVPGDSLITQGEPYEGVCGAISGPLTVTFNVMAAPNTPFHVANGFQANFFKPAGMQLRSPGIFAANGSGAGVPAGTHYNQTTFTHTSLSVCNATPSACPITTGGVPNFLILYTTGGENMQCGVPPPAPGLPPPTPACPVTTFPATGQNIGFKVGANVQYWINPVYLGEGFLGQEQWNIPLNTLPPGSYTITARFASQDLAAQNLTVAFGTGN